MHIVFFKSIPKVSFLYLFRSLIITLVETNDGLQFADETFLSSDYVKEVTMKNTQFYRKYLRNCHVLN